MNFPVIAKENDDEHTWTLVQCSCDLTDDADALLQGTIKLVRDAYGESLLLAELSGQPNLAALEADPLVGDTFDLDAVLSAFRSGLPDPAEEKAGGKPMHLRNYRSEATEILTRGALSEVHGIQFPAHPQLGKVNANQPQLGFDGWGIVGNSQDGYSLVLIQVKATDAKKCPSPEATKLALECRNVPREKDKLCRALSVLSLQLKGTDFFLPLVAMLQKLGRNEEIGMMVAPVIVRGVNTACLGCIDPVRLDRSNFTPATAHGVVIGLSVDLTEFGDRVMSLARVA